MNNKNEIRRAMRTRRQQQSRREYLHATQQFLRLGQRLLCPFRRIAFFMPFDGEPNIAPLQALLRRRGAQISLPKISRQSENTMRFVPVNDKKMTRNRFGITEPIGHRQLRLSEFDVILLPLTAFDQRGNRLGMGAGFYDRALQSRRGRLLRRPQLIGVAYHWQEIAQLPTDPWDLPLHAILTDKKIIRL